VKRFPGPAPGTSWQRYKREIKAFPVRPAGSFRALIQVDLALSRFEPLRMKDFQASVSPNVELT
jgi:hypothetical protein